MIVDARAPAPACLAGLVCVGGSYRVTELVTDDHLRISTSLPDPPTNLPREFCSLFPTPPTRCPEGEGGGSVLVVLVSFTSTYEGRYVEYIVAFPDATRQNMSCHRCRPSAAPSVLGKVPTLQIHSTYRHGAPSTCRVGTFSSVRLSSPSPLVPSSPRPLLFPTRASRLASLRSNRTRQASFSVGEPVKQGRRCQVGPW